MPEEKYKILRLGDGSEYQLYDPSPFERRYDLRDNWAESLMQDVVSKAAAEGRPVTDRDLIEDSVIYAFNLARLSRFAAKNHFVPGLVDAVCDLMWPVIDLDIHYVQPGTVARFTFMDRKNPYHRLCRRPHPDNPSVTIESIFHENKHRVQCMRAAHKLTDTFRACLGWKDPVDIMLLMGRITTAKERKTTATRILRALPDALVFLNSAHSEIVPDKLIQRFRNDIRQADLSKYGQPLEDIGRAGSTKYFKLG